MGGNVLSRVQAWRELTLRGKQMRTARVWHRNRVLRQQEALTETHAKGLQFQIVQWSNNVIMLGPGTVRIALTCLGTSY